VAVLVAGSAPGIPAPIAQPDALLVRLGAMAPGDTGRAGVRAEALDWYLPMTVFLARRFIGRGEPLADLTQVAAIGLIKAVDRFDASRGVAFASYAIPTILGELKRHFRDTTWNVRVPRRMQELTLRLPAATEELSQALRRAPTTGELAARLGVSAVDVLAARSCASAYRPLSIDQQVPGTERLSLSDSLGSLDRGIDAIDDRETLRPLLAGLPAREQRIITMRFYGGLSQAQIADEIGVSQMQISRLLVASLAQLRAGLLADDRQPDTAAAKITQTGAKRAAR
jgi:RNA polymerase sigma-B factor